MDKKEYSLKEFLSYMNCPLQHDFIYNKKILNNENIMGNTDMKGKAYKDALATTISYYYSQRMAEETILLKGLYSKFQKTFYDLVGYEGEKNPFDRDISETRHLVQMDKKKYINKGWEAIKKFYDDAEKEQQVIIAHNYPFKIPFGNIYITGNIDLIREVKDEYSPNRFVEVVSYSPSQRLPDEFTINHDLYITFMYYAFNYIFKNPPDRFVMSYISLKKELIVYRTKKEYNRLFASIKYFEEDINKKELYPRQGINCNICPVKEYCDKYYF